MRHLKAYVPSTVRSQIKIARAEATIRLGVRRYSQPSLFGIGQEMRRVLPAHGTFLEIGANDGYSQSNTYHLEKIHGWRGILIEPNPSLYTMCKRHRRLSTCFAAACVGPNGPSTVNISDEGLISKIVTSGRSEVASIEVPTAQISELIDISPISAVTFMSIDVEGAELGVLDGLDLDRHCPEFLLVETKTPDMTTRLLGNYMSAPRAITHHDYLYVRRQPVSASAVG